METNHTFQTHFEKAQTWVQQGYDAVFIEQQLQSEGLEQSAILELFNAIKRERHVKRTQNANILIVFGVVLMVIGFSSSIALYHMDETFGMSLYGLTGAGLLLLFAGMYLLFQ